MLPVHTSGRGTLLFADRRGHAHHLAHHACGTHHAHRAQGHVRDTDVPSSHKQIVDTARAETATGNGIARFVAFVYGYGKEFLTRKVLGVRWVWARDSRPIRKAAPAKLPMLASPVQSAKSRPGKRSSSLVRIFLPSTAMILLPRVSTFLKWSQGCRTSAGDSF